MGRKLAFWIAVACVLASPSGSAAETAAPSAVRGDARASFQITPLVQRLSGRRGQRIKFEFEVRTLDRPQSLTIRAVGLRQQLNGLIAADETAPPPDAVHLSGPLQLNLQAQQTATLRGHVDVPLSPAPSHAYGILVMDMGQPLHDRPQTGDTRSHIGVRFVTQYLLRLEVDVTNGRQENGKELRIESARLVEHEGQPFVQADVVNPTDAVVEFQLFCRLMQNNGREIIPAFGMALPVRASRQEPARYESTVFAQSRVRLAAPVPQAVFAGQYRLELEWISYRRKGGEASFPVIVRDDDFPAQGSTSVQVADVLRISPAQIELSFGRGGNRRLPLSITNSSLQPFDINVAARNLDGTPADWVLISPASLPLLPGRKRNILLAARAAGDVEQHRYGYLRVEVSSAETLYATQDLPLALLGRMQTEPNFQTGSLRWDAAGGRPAFVLPIRNQATVHLALNGRLILTDPLGQSVEIRGGFDRWLLPGQQDEIRFPLHRSLPPGSYPVKVQVQTTKGQTPLELDQQVQVQPVDFGRETSPGYRDQ